MTDISNEELAVLIKEGHAEYIPELWNQTERFIWHQARRRAYSLEGRGGVTAEDLYQSGFFALLAAVRSFDPESGYKLITYLVRHLQNAFAETAGYRTKLQRKDPLQFADSLDAPFEDDGGNQGTLLDGVCDPAAELSIDAVGERERALQHHNDLEAALGYLPASQSAAIHLKYYLGVKALSPEDRKEEMAAIRALRNPKISRQLRQYLQGE